MTTIQHLLKVKGDGIFTVTPETSVFETLQLMAEHDIGSVIVIDEGKVAGIMTERDYARKVILQDRSSRQTPVRDIMSSCVVVIDPEQSVEQCMALMNARRVRHLPVMKGDQLIGVVSMRDVVKQMIDEQGFLIDQLEHYITDRPA